MTWRVEFDRDVLQGQDVMLVVKEMPDGSRECYTLKREVILSRTDATTPYPVTTFTDRDLREFLTALVASIPARFNLGGSNDLRAHLEDMRKIAFKQLGMPQ